jgi:hypothetical protein
LTGNVSITNTQGNAFGVSPGGHFDIPAKNAPTVETITFTPDVTSAGATLSITSNDPKNGSINIQVSGTGLSGKLLVPRTLVITATATGAVGRQTFTPGTAKLVLRNVGKGVLTGSVAAASAPFDDGGGGMGTLQPGQSSPPITITFNPSSTTTVTQQLAITAQPPSTGSTTVTLKGIVKVMK